MAKSLASRIESNSGIGLPVGFSSPVMEVGDPLFQPTAYTLFVSQKGQNFGQMMISIPDLQDGDPVLVEGPSAKPVKLNPFRFYLITAFQHFSVVDQTGMILKSTTVPTYVKEHPEDKWNEHIETVLIAVVRGDEGARLVPCRCTFKTTKCKAAYKALEARKQAENPVLWERLSPEHKASLIATEPWARYTATVTLKRMTSKASGFAYVAADSFIVPTGVADWKLLSEYFREQKNHDACSAMTEAHSKRVAIVKSKLVNPEDQR